MDEKTLFKKMVVEANNVENSAHTRKVCKECAEWFEKRLTVGVKPKLVRIPFSWTFQAVCGNCDRPLQTDEGSCPECGCKIEWKGLE